MTDTLWNDFSEFQKPVDDSYPNRVAAFRVSDGNYHDAHAAQNLAWANSRVGSKLDFFIVYCVYRPGTDWVGAVKAVVGTPNPRLVVMVDVESWGGAIKGDHSADINAGVSQLASWLGSLSRVIGYGNASDLNSIWPSKALAPNHIVLANYVANAAYPNKFAHQYKAGISGGTAQQGDYNSADGYDIPSLLTLLGLSGSAAQPSAPAAPAAPDYSHINQTGHSTADLQTQLGRHGFPTTVDNLPGPDTQAKIEAFQSAIGITVDGIAGDDTAGYLWLAVDGADGVRTIKMEQLALVHAGRSVGASGIDGSRGHDTIYAEQQHTGASPDGVDGPDTERHLQQHLINLGYSVGPTGADGIRGANTIKGLQQSLNDGKF